MYKSANTASIKKASVTYPEPTKSHKAISENIKVISFADAGTERNRTRAKAPATAMPAPIFPFTAMMTVCTARGRKISENMRLLLRVFEVKR